MDADLFQEASEIFLEARRLGPEERGALLMRRCGENAALREQVEILLAADQGPDPFDMLANKLHGIREVMPLTPSAPWTETAVSLQRGQKVAVSEGPGAHIGRYKLLQLIGEGGFGSVFMAEQEKPVRRRVALKIIKLGMDTRQVIARFEAERQALAMMDHPSVAKVLDGGATDTGRPYFVMELVKGTPITEYCDKNNLTIPKRLELFAQVCQAVQHAHQKGLIHRDIKPSNVLVTTQDDRPVVKVIDFGIAKAIQARLTEKTLFTDFRQMIGTPEYMSPEQAEGDLDVDTRTDVYALGVLLYELLAGSPPFDARELRSKAFAEMQRIIREVEPPTPSTRLSAIEDTLPSVAAHRSVDPRKLAAIVHGELDWIVMRCLEKDRNRRYQTANALAEDVQHYLTDEPVQARPPTRTYRMKKFIRRNKAGVLAGSAIMAALILGLTFASIGFVQARHQAVRADREAKNARTQAARSEQVAQFLKDMLQGVEPGVARGRDTRMLREILDRTAIRMNEDLKDQPQVEIELRSVLANAYHELGLFKEMEQTARGALALARSNSGAESIAVADAMQQLGDALFHLRASRESQAVLRQAIALQRKLRGESLQLADALYHLSFLLGASPEAESACREALSIRRDLLGRDHAEIARSLDSLGSFLRRNGRLAEAESSFRESLAMRHRLFGNDHPDLGRSYSNLASLLAQQGRLTEVEGFDRDMVELNRKMRGSESPQVGASLADLAGLLSRQNKVAEAEAVYREALPIARKQMSSEHSSDFGLGKLAEMLIAQGKLDQAEGLIEELAPASHEPSRTSAGLLRSLGDAYAAREHWPQAAERFAMLMKLNQFDTPGDITLDHSRYAPALIEAGDPAGYERYRKDALNDFARTGDSTDAERIIRLSLLLPADQRMLESVAPLLPVATGTDPNTHPWPWAYLAAALVEYRSAHCGKAIVWCRRDLTFGPFGSDGPRNATSRVIAAMSLHQLHRDSEAAAQLAKGREPIENEFRRGLVIHGDGFWFDWVIARILLREADRLMPAGTRPAGADSLADSFEESLASERLQNLLTWLPTDESLLVSAQVNLARVLRQNEKMAEASQTCLQAAKHCHEALPQYEKLAADPSRHQDCWRFAIAYEQLAQLLKELGQDQEAEKGYRDAQTIWIKLVSGSNSVDDRWHLAVNHDLLGHLLRDTERLDEAAGSYQKALPIWEKLAAETNSEDQLQHLSWTRTALADLFAAQGKPAEAQAVFRDAEAAFREAIRRQPSSAELQMKLGGLLKSQRKFDEAAVAYGEAIRLRPDMLEARRERGNCYRDKGDFKKALEDFSELIRLKPDVSWYWCDRGFVYLNSREHEKAIVDLSKAISLVDAVTERHMRGEAYRALGQWQQAERDFSKAIEFRPDWDSWQRRGQVYAETGQWGKAAADLSKAAKMAPGITPSYYLALVYLAREDQAAYRTTCVALLERAAQSPDANLAFWAAWTCVLAPDAGVDAARVIQLAAQAVASNPKRSDYLAAHGAALYRAGRHDEAVKRLLESEAAFAHTPGGGTVAYTRLFLAMTYQQLDNHAEAQHWLDSAKRATTQPGSATKPTTTQQQPIAERWNRRVTLQLLRREAEGVLTAKKGEVGHQEPTFRSGTTQPQ